MDPQMHALMDDMRLRLPGCKPVGGIIIDKDGGGFDRDVHPLAVLIVHLRLVSVETDLADQRGIHGQPGILEPGSHIRGDGFGINGTGAEERIGVMVLEDRGSDLVERTMVDHWDEPAVEAEQAGIGILVIDGYGAGREKGRIAITQYGIALRLVPLAHSILID